MTRFTFAGLGFALGLLTAASALMLAGDAGAAAPEKPKCYMSMRDIPGLDMDAPIETLRYADLPLCD